MMRALPSFSCMMVRLIIHVNFRACIFPLTSEIESRNIMNVIRLARYMQWSRDRMGPRIKTLKEALDGDKEKGCQEKEEKVTRSGAKSPRFFQGKIVVTGVHLNTLFYFEQLAVCHQESRAEC